tara:strand:- start:772 stop:1197 length:426 start_codon:yes stop_codon:yes gene_type:complete
MFWIIFALFGALFSTMSKIIIKTLLNKNKVNEITSFVLLGSIISAFLLFLMLKPKKMSNFSNKTIFMGIVAGMLIPLITYSLNKSYNLVSNLAFTAVIFSVSVTFLLLLSSIHIFNVKVKNITFLGIIIALLGVTIIIMTK